MPTSTGALAANTQIKPLGTRGIVTYVEANTAGATLRDGNGSGKILATIAAGATSDFGEVEFKNGLHVAITGGTAVVHIG